MQAVGMSNDQDTDIEMGELAAKYERLAVENERLLADGRASAAREATALADNEAMLNFITNVAEGATALIRRADNECDGSNAAQQGSDVEHATPPVRFHPLSYWLEGLEFLIACGLYVGIYMLWRHYVQIDEWREVVGDLSGVYTNLLAFGSLLSIVHFTSQWIKRKNAA